MSTVNSSKLLGTIRSLESSFNNASVEVDKVNHSPPISNDYSDIGDVAFSCVHCGALLWYAKRNRKNRQTQNPEFSLCCMNGKVDLPLLKTAPDTLVQLHNNVDERSKHFLRNIRAYNMIFSFTSFGGKVDRSVNNGSTPYVFKVGGQVHHLVGSLLPVDNTTPKFAQLYIYDTDNEMGNRMNCLRNCDKAENLDTEIVSSLQKMVDDNNVIAQSFRCARDRYKKGDFNGLKMRLIRKRDKDGRTYNLPTASEIAALVVGDIDSSIGDRDIILETQSGTLKRIDVKHPLYLALQYPLLFSYEFQKRGLPHAHILLFLHPHDKPSTASDIDSLISTEIPNPNDNPALHEVVNNFMIHGPYGVANLKSTCMHGGKCTKRFPKKFLPGTTIDEEGFPHYKRRYDGITVNKKGVHLDSRYVVPYNAKLLLKYQAHMNVEYTCQSIAIKYLFKYIHKGNDRVTATFHHSPTNSQTTSSTDEIKMFYDCRYISSCEAVWRILGFEIHSRYPLVQRLSFHLPDQKFVVFKDDSSISEVMTNAMEKKSMFEAWMEANNKYDEGRGLTYPEFPTKFVYQENNHEWHPRKRGFSIGRLTHVPPKNRDDYYLRMLLNTQKGCKNYEDLRIVSGVIFPTFKEACYSLGFLDDDKEYIDAIKEASFWASGHYIRRLFALLLFCNNMSRPKYVWEQCWKLLSDDILYQQRKNMNRQDLVMTDEQIKNVSLAEIESCLQSNGKSLCNYPTMPCPTGESVLHVTNKLILDELSYDRSLLAKEHQHLLASLTEEQRNVYHRIMEATSANKGGFFFLYGFGGTGKIFIWKTLSAAFRSIGEIVLNVASSGIASLLLPGGRTAHSRMCIPIDISEDSICNIKQNSPQAELLSRAKLIIWDEAPMVHKFCFEALDRTLRDILRFSNQKSFETSFGGKVVVLGGDFRQILSVIPHGGRQEIVHATINSSHLWHYCQMLTLTKNMRLYSQGSNNDVMEIKMFSEWLLDVGDGKVGDNVDGYSTIKIPDEILINDCNDPISALVEFAYPNLLKNMLNASFFQERAILTPTLADVSMLNEYLMSKIPEEEKVYLSLDSICKAEGNNNVEEEAFPP
ncbi:uncharacterized protein LOC133296511 [Gastrolobium bilobum]|uniref:uncharacterized protein LOC133296511 n=1 Tax=Gastrolobium bilobum TaxID=150636 RepID=UPI002AB13AB2|nr:uncharacterized protein LOC133296511 [Gastrolobium bilobum]